MPGYKAHLIAGLAAPAIIAYTTGFGWCPTLPIGMAVSGVLSLTPDIDAEYSKIRQLCPIAAKIYDKLPKNLFFKHRGLFTHSVWTLVPFLLLYIKFESWVTLGALIGVASHHALDATSQKGLPMYLIPFKGRLD